MRAYQTWKHILYIPIQYNPWSWYIYLYSSWFIYLYIWHIIIYLHLVDFTNIWNPLQNYVTKLSRFRQVLRSQTAGRAGPISKAVAPKPGPHRRRNCSWKFKASKTLGFLTSGGNSLHPGRNPRLDFCEYVTGPLEVRKIIGTKTITMTSGAIR